MRSSTPRIRSNSRCIIRSKGRGGCWHPSPPRAFMLQGARRQPSLIARPHPEVRGDSPHYEEDAVELHGGCTRRATDSAQDGSHDAPHRGLTYPAITDLDKACT